MLTSLFSFFYVTGECHRLLHRGWTRLRPYTYYPSSQSRSLFYTSITHPPSSFWYVPLLKVELSWIKIRNMWMPNGPGHSSQYQSKVSSSQPSNVLSITIEILDHVDVLFFWRSSILSRSPPCFFVKQKSCSPITLQNLSVIRTSEITQEEIFPVQSRLQSLHCNSSDFQDSWLVFF